MGGEAPALPAGKTGQHLAMRPEQGGVALADAADIFIADAGTLALNFVGSDTVHALTVAGVAKAPGDWGSAGSGAPNVDPHLAGTGILTVTTGPVGNAYDPWAAAAGLAGPNALPSADPDGDGVQNLLEFVLASSPTAGAPLVQPAGIFTAQALTIGFSRSDASETTVAPKR